MGAGRPPDGPKHVDRLDGDDEAKRRLRIVLETLSGERSIEQACAELGVSASRFHEMRKDALQSALEGLAPGASGRPKQPVPDPDPERLAALERQNQELQAELLASMVRTEIALGMPHLFTKKARAEIKKKARDARRWLRGASRGRGSGT
jgi:transposase-like protein